MSDGRRRIGVIAQWVTAGAGLFAWALAVLAHVSRDILPADAGELQLVARHLGVAHPPGYPLYTLVAHAFGWLLAAPLDLFRDYRVSGHIVFSPWYWRLDAWAAAVNLLSLILAICTLLLVFRIGRRLSGLFAGGMLAAAALAFCPTFLAQSTVANIRMPTALLAALLLDQATAWGENPRPWRLVALAFTLALAFGHHPSLVFLAVPLALYLLSRRGQLQVSRGLAIAIPTAFLVGLLPLAYLPLRDAAGAILAPGNLTTLSGLVYHVTGAGFRGDLGLDGFQTFADRLAVVGNILVLQFGRGLLVAALGAAWLAWRRPREAILVLGSSGIVALLGAVYRAPQTMEYLLPAYVALAVVMGTAGAAIRDVVEWRLRLRDAAREWERTHWGRMDVHDLNVVADSPELAVNDRSSAANLSPRALDDSANVMDSSSRAANAASRTAQSSSLVVTGLTLSLAAIAIARGAPQLDAVGHANEEQSVAALGRLAECSARTGRPIFANWHFAMPLTYLAERQEGDMFRPEVRYVYPNPEGVETIGETWRRRVVEEVDANGPVLLTNRTREILDAGLPLWPEGPFFSTGGGLCLTPSEVEYRLKVPDRPPVDFGGLVSMVRLTGGGDSAGALLAYQAEFEALRPVTETLTIVGQLVDPATGTVWAQLDHGFPAERWNEVGGLYDRLALIPFRGEIPDLLEAVIGVYRSTPSGPQRLPTAAGDLGAIVQRINAHLAGHPSYGLNVPGEGTAVIPGAIPFGHAMSLLATHVRPDPDGHALTVDLDWLAERAYASDYTVSVQVRGDGWAAQDDGTPAQGAIPTLKWLPGMRIHDRHRVLLPEGVQLNDPMTVTVGVYDAFSLEPLPVTDAARVMAGEGQAARVWAR